MCGKDGAMIRNHLAKQGSPPHVRERHYHDNRYGPHPGITPACAGKTVCVL